jgi:hypothetical protein
VAPARTASFSFATSISTRAFATLGEAERAALRAKLVDLWASHNQTSDPGRTIVDAEYLEVVGLRA